MDKAWFLKELCSPMRLSFKCANAHILDTTSPFILLPLNISRDVSEWFGMDMRWWLHQSCWKRDANYSVSVNSSRWPRHDSFHPPCLQLNTRWWKTKKTSSLDRWYQSDQGSFSSFRYSRSMTDFTAFPLCLHLKTYGGKHPNHHHLNVISERSKILHVETISLAIENCSMNNWTLITSWAVEGTVSPKVLSYILPKGTHRVSLNI